MADVRTAEDDLMPKLRFTGFNTPWKKGKLSTGIKLISGQHLSPSEYNKSSDGIPYFTGPSDFTNNPATVAKWTTQSNHIAIESDTLLTVKGSGVGSLLYLKMPKVAMGRQLMAIRGNSFYSGFIYHLLGTKQQYYEKLAYGNMIPGVSRQDILSTKIAIPTLPEQQKIASFLSAVDKKIQQLTRKKELLEEYKKGVMQKLFSREIRFRDEHGEEFPEWEEKTLGDVAYITTGSSNRVDSHLEGEYVFFDRSEDIRTSDKYLFDTEAIIVPGEGSEFLPKYYHGKFDLHQRTYAIIQFQGVYSWYLYYLITYDQKHFLRHAVGSTVKSLRLPIFQKMPIPFPTLKEQSQIGDMLKSIDSSIRTIADQHRITTRFKRGLLQQMFV